MKNIMVDLETLGIRSNAAILSIAMVEFDLNGNKGKVFEEFICLDSSLKVGLKIEVLTLEWWLKQPKDLMMRNLFNEKAVPLENALENCVRWIEIHGFNKDDVMFWSKSPSFDLSILRYQFRKFGMDAPFRYTRERDVRTIFALRPSIVSRLEKERKLPHDAISDCLHQIRILTEIFREIGIQEVA